MQFLKTLFWVIVAVAVVLFASSNWETVVTVNLWSGLQADIKLPVLAIGAFLLGFLPTFLVYRTRVWGLTRRLETQGQVHVANAPVARPVAPPEPEARSNI
jgi:putative membrane protein